MEKLISIGIQDALTYIYGPHSHRNWEVTYYIEGNGLNITNGIVFPFQSGTIICQPPGLTHEDKSEHGYKNIFFEVDSLFPTSEPVVVFDTESKNILSVIRLMYQEYFGENDPLVISSFISVLTVYLSRLSKESIGNPYVDKMKKNIIFNYSSPNYNISDCFQSLPWSGSQLRRYFKSETGLTPQKYLERTRMRQAKKFLLYDSLTVVQVSQMCGYSDPYYFSRAFKKYTGASPTEYREKRFKKQTARNG